MLCNLLVLLVHFLKDPATSIFRIEDLKVEIKVSSETSVSFYQTALRHVTEDRGLHIRRHRTSDLTASFLFVLRRSVGRRGEVMTVINGRLVAPGHLVVRKMSGIRFKKKSQKYILGTEEDHENRNLSRKLPTREAKCSVFGSLNPIPNY